ncbi:hypothetical protein BST61_g10414 [Cercospora zeina]
MPRLEFVTLDVFTKENFAGNPLAVVKVPEGIDEVPTEVMQKIAREFNLSETIFIHDAKQGADGLPEWRVRIFLTVAEIPFAGHPTIGAAVYALGNLSASGGSGGEASSDSRSSSTSNSIIKGRFLANAGPMDLTFNPSTGKATAKIAHNFHQHVQYPFTVDEVFALQPGLMKKTTKKADAAAADAADAAAAAAATAATAAAAAAAATTNLSQQDIAVVSPVKGMNFLTVELPNLTALAAITTSCNKSAPKLDDEWDVGFCGSYFYVFLVTSSSLSTTDDNNNNKSASSSSSDEDDDDDDEIEHIQLQSRMIEGLIEDPATGSAGCGLACHVALKRGRSRITKFGILQGVEMGRRSEVEVVVRLSEDLRAVEEVELGGSAVRVMDGWVGY